MANDVLGVQYLTGNDVYFLIRDREGAVADVTTSNAFETYATGDLGDYDLVATEQGTASGYYAATVPSWVPPGLYHFNAFDRAGGSPAEGDSIVGFGTIEIRNEDLATPEIYPDGVKRATYGQVSSIGENIDKLVSVITVSAVDDATPTTTVFDTDLTISEDDWCNDQFLVFTSGALAGEARKISDYDGTTNVGRITLSAATTSACSNNDTFVIIGRSE